MNHFWLFTELQVDRITGILLDISELKISRHKLFTWMITSNGVKVGSDDGINVGLLEGDCELDGWIDTDGDEVGQTLPKRLDISLDSKSPPSIIIMP